jgi:hypothetical protein
LRFNSDVPPYDEQVNPVDQCAFVSGDAKALVAKARLRPRREIERARELAELWHWRSRTRQLGESKGVESADGIVRLAATAARKRGDFRPIRDDFPAFGKAYRELTAEQWAEVGSITRERHFALNWLCGYASRNRWDATPTDT